MNVPSPQLRSEEQFEGQESESASLPPSFPVSRKPLPPLPGQEGQNGKVAVATTRTPNLGFNPSITVECILPFTHPNPSTRDKRFHLLQITTMVRRRRKKKTWWLWRCTTSLALNHTTCVWSKEANTSSLRIAMSTGSRHATNMGNPRETYIQKCRINVLLQKKCFF